MQRTVLFVIICLTLGFPVYAEDADSTLLTVDRIFNSREFSPQYSGRTRWLEHGAGYTALEPSANASGGRDIIKYDTETGRRDIYVPAAWLTPRGAAAPLSIDDYHWSADGSRLLVFTNTARVWRANTRGDYWVLNLHDSTLMQLGGSFWSSPIPPASGVRTQEGITGF